MTGERGAVPRLACIVIVLLACHGAWSAASPRPDDRGRHGTATVLRIVHLMGTVFEIEVAAEDRESALAASEAAIRTAAAAESRLSTWMVGTELSNLNQHPPESWVSLSAALERDLLEARHWWAETGGAFDPGVASLVAAWALRHGGRVPSESELVAARAASGMRHLEIDRGRARRGVPGFGVEEGAFGKGVALRDAAAAALEAGAISIFMDLGGQLMVAGAAPPRTVGVAHPHSRQEPVAWLRFDVGSLATTGNSERSTSVGGRKIGHVVDPATGVPLRSWGSVTVLSRDPVAADCLATALYVMGPELGIGWARQRSDVEALFAIVRTDGVELVATNGIAGLIETKERSVAHRATAGEPAARGGGLDDQ